MTDDDSDDASQPYAPNAPPRAERPWLKPLLFFAIALACGVIGGGLWQWLHHKPAAHAPSSDAAVTLDPAHRALPAPMAGGTAGLPPPASPDANAPHIVSAAPDAAASPASETASPAATENTADASQDMPASSPEVAQETGDSEPQVLPHSPPVYPIDALRARAEGDVLLKVSIDAQGDVQDVLVAGSSGNGALDRSAMEAARSWRYKPAMHGGQAVAGMIEVPVDFRLDAQD